jgi:iron complex outermembrane receptor protein
MTLQTYFDYTARSDYTRAELRKTADFDLQHRIAIKQRHELIWGTRYRYTANHTSGSFLFSFDPRVQINSTISVFVQDEITLLPERLRLILGLRRDYTADHDLELQPDLRLLWSPRSNQTLWFAVARPIGEPPVGARTAQTRIPPLPGTEAIADASAFLPNPDVEDTRALSFQAGYRGQLFRRITASLEGFYTRHTGMLSPDRGAPFLETDPPPPHRVLPLSFQNSLHGETHGVELSATWQPVSRWKLAGSYTWLHMDLHDTLTGDAGTALTTGSSPQQQAQIRSYLTLPRAWEWDTSLYAVGRLPAMAVPAYVRLDTRLGWRWSERGEISLVGQNLLRSHHPEFGSQAGTILSTESKRSAYAKITWTF